MLHLLRARLSLDFTQFFFVFICEQTWLTRQRCSLLRPNHATSPHPSPPTTWIGYSSITLLIFAKLSTRAHTPNADEWKERCDGPRITQKCYLLVELFEFLLCSVLRLRTKAKNNTLEDGLPDVLKL